MNKDISVIIAAHKKYKMPEDGMYIPMQVGSQGKPDIGYIRDNTGDNISDKNKNFCELTGMYWLTPQRRNPCKQKAILGEKSVFSPILRLHQHHRPQNTILIRVQTQRRIAPPRIIIRLPRA